MTEAHSCVAITGATGFAGRHIMPKLLMGGHRVRALVRSRKRLTAASGNTHTIEGDIFDDRCVEQLVDGADTVIHLIGIIDEKPMNGITFENLHVNATTRLLQAAKDAGVSRWVHMSALGARPNAVANYHKTKWEAEQAVRDSGLDWTIIRPSIIHGPDGEFMKLIKTWWTSFFNPPLIVPYFGAGPFGAGGSGHLQPVWVDDVAQCFVDALMNPRTIGETYPMGGPERYTFPELYAAVRDRLPKTRCKMIVPMPAWKAKILGRLPGMPFNWDQVVMSQEDSICDTSKVEHDFGIKLAGFTEKLDEYAANIE